MIERQLLFRPGDAFSPELVEESARLLRTNDYLYDVEMKPALRPDGKVDVEVVTRDVYFSRTDGRPLKYFIQTLDGYKFAAARRHKRVTGSQPG